MRTHARWAGDGARLAPIARAIASAVAIAIAIAMTIACAGASAAAPASGPAPRLVLAIHGGAGEIRREDLTAQKEARYRESLGAALDAGYAVLERGGSSLDAVTAVVKMLEDDPLFNAGRGAVLNAAGEAELDAAVMDGSKLAAGAVAGVQHVRNPVELARRVMERTPHVMLVGSGAEAFAVEQGFELVPNEYFRTEERQRELEREIERVRERSGGASADTAATAAPSATAASTAFGTVGAVALDARGNLAAATSTGGMTNKRPGRVGDTPIVGAGTYAENGNCAVSATGEGEYFMRTVAAYDVCARMRYARVPLASAVRNVVHGRLAAMRAQGGMIALDGRGDVVLDFNTTAMYRAVRTSDGRREIAVFR